ncbi:Similar to MRPL2: 39S ribosomal protein L2 [Cotesia congregata]|uniref:Mitochondrial (Homo sapiens) n=1 Tax=Cotesia congregata TaxID=51543 RepID=A0A8J2H689_COTCN|nr:Similar to MRPL2: 39S ribosomal protein L2 [Cotesia congregata]
MAMSGLLKRVIGKNFDLIIYNGSVACQVQQSRPTTSWTYVEKPKPGIKGKSYRRFVHFEDKYTVKPLQVTNLAGRDPITGRLVNIGIGGGIKHKYHWIKWKRDGPTDPDAPPKEERVIEVFQDGCRTAHVALVAHGKELSYILATENMKAGQVIRTSLGIPRMTVRAFEGDAYPLGALPIGTVVNCVEKYPGLGGFLIHAAGTSGTILRRDGDDRVIVQMPSKKLFSLSKTCMATVGRLSNISHGSTPIGSAQRNRELGNRPRSGLWHRKDGRHGRKIKPIPPPIHFNTKENFYRKKPYALTHSAYNTHLDSKRKPTVPVRDDSVY